MAMAREMEMIRSINRQCVLQKKKNICAYLPHFAYSWGHRLLILV